MCTIRSWSGIRCDGRTLLHIGFSWSPAIISTIFMVVFRAHPLTAMSSMMRARHPTWRILAVANDDDGDVYLEQLSRMSHWCIRANARVSRAQYFNKDSRNVRRSAADSVGSVAMR